jgi:hypothetical protein
MSHWAPSGLVQVQNPCEPELDLGSSSIGFRFKVHKNSRTGPEVWFKVQGNLPPNRTLATLSASEEVQFWKSELGDRQGRDSGGNIHR